MSDTSRPHGTPESYKQPKGESEPSKQKGAPSVSNKGKEKHEKDDSSGSEENTTKKQQNSI
jgi:hypothetical protein